MMYLRISKIIYKTSITLLFVFIFTNTHAEEYSVSAKEWRSYVEPLLPLGENMVNLLDDPQDSQLRQDVYAFLFSQIAAGYAGRVYNSPEYPDFAPMYNLLFNQGFPNPDDSYYLVPLVDNGVYKISGFRGSVRYVNFQIGSGMTVPYGTGTLGPSIADYNIDSLNLGDDGEFEVILSPTRPAGYNKDWWKLGAGATYLIVRQRAYDWIKEVDGRFAIERLDLPAAKPRPTADQIAAGLRSVSEWAETFGKLSLDGPWVKHLRNSALVNKVVPKDYASASGHATQRYVEGIFELDDDEALIIETDIPEHCSYWGFQLADELWRSLDYVHRQSSLNGFTARLDNDGKFRVIVSKQDPGVPNWLDTVDRNKGIIYGRWTECSSAPTPTVKKVNVVDVRKYLPENTAVVTKAEREEAIRLRRKGAQLRRRW